MTMTTLELQAAQIEWLKEKFTAEVEIFEDLKIVTYTKETRGERRPMLQVFKGRAGKPIANYYYRTPVDRTRAIAEHRKRASERQAYNAEKAAAKKNIVPVFEKGDVFHCSWGYDQTNNDFYEVVEVLSKHYANVRPIGATSVEGSHGFMSCKLVCTPGNFSGEEFRAKVTRGTYKDAREHILVRGHDYAYKMQDVKSECYDSHYA